MPDNKEKEKEKEEEQDEKKAIPTYPKCLIDDELKNLIKAKFHLIYCVTWEERRVIDSLQQICDDGIISFQGVQVWDSARGLRMADRPTKPGGPVEGGEALTTPDEILDYITKKAEAVRGKKFDMKAARGPIYVLCDMFRYLCHDGLEPQVERKMRALSSLLKRTTIHVIVTSPVLELPTALQKCMTILDYPLPAKEQLAVMVANARAKLLERKRVSEKDLAETPDEQVVRALQGLTLNEAEDALAKAVVTTNRFDIKTLLELKRQIIRKSELLDYLVDKATMDEVGGFLGVKQFVALRKNAFTDAAKEYGLPPPKGLFLLGVQGSGKSLASKAIAAAFKVPLLKLDMGRMFGSLMGESENRVRMALMVAESVAPCVLLVDEIDKALSGSHGATTDSGTTKRVIGTLLDWMQEKTSPVFIVACANSIANMDAATLRKGRFDEMFFVDLPTPEIRKEIFAIHIAKKKRDPKKFKLEELVNKTEGFSGAEIEAAVVDAMFAAFAEKGREFTTADIVRSCESTTALSVTMKEQLDALREDVRDRKMRNASEPYYKDPESDDARFADLGVGERMGEISGKEKKATTETY